MRTQRRRKEKGRKRLAFLLVLLLAFGSVITVLAAEDTVEGEGTPAPDGMNATIYITSDDEYTLYVDGVLLGEGKASDQWTKLDVYRVALDPDDYVVAVKAMDTAWTISGITVTVVFDDNTMNKGNAANGWKQTTEEYTGWYTKHYTPAYGETWRLVHDIPDGRRDGGWIKNQEPIGNLTWIWNENFLDDRQDDNTGTFDRVVYFRSTVKASAVGTGDIPREILLYEPAEIAEGEPTLPQTGDGNPMYFYLAGLFLVAAGIITRRKVTA